MQTAASAPALIDQLALAEGALAEAQAMLRKFVPESIIERLKSAPGQPITDHYASASVLFADIAGFVAIARKLGSRKTVALLDTLTREFDRTAARHGVEKIKSIGDGYMAVAGVPVAQRDHRDRLARVALDMREAVRRVAGETGLDLKVRIGIASGPVTAGVIGSSKMAFDVWGDTVNLAARLERLANADEIVLSQAATDGLGRAFTVGYRGEARIRGFGTEETWVLG